MHDDLNALEARGYEDSQLFDAISDATVRVKVHFRELEARLCEYIAQADAVVGCVAWLTSEPVLTALAAKEAVSIVVQKEDFLRPDLHHSTAWPKRLRELYGRLPSNFRLDDLTFAHTNLSGFSCNGDVLIQAVRCAGIRGGKVSATPKMHHKFFVFMRNSEWEGFGMIPVPYAVWTGSFNPTRNGTRSLENAVYLDAGKEAQRNVNPQIAYFEEWAQIVVHSEPLDWRHECVATNLVDV